MCPLSQVSLRIPFVNPVWAHFISVSVEIIPIRDDSSERGCAAPSRRSGALARREGGSTSRSALEPQEIPVSLQPFVPFLPAAAGPADTAALLWLRLCRTALYRRFSAPAAWEQRPADYKSAGTTD